MPEPDKQPATGTQLLGVGFEFAAAVAGFTLVGYWVDRHYQVGPWGVLIGLALGLIGGMYNLIRQSLAAAKTAGRGGKTSSGDREP